MKVNGTTNTTHGAPGLSALFTGVTIMELCRIDASVGTFFLVHNSIGMDCVFQLGSQEQKDKFLPGGMTFEDVFCFGLTEPNYGSDASSLVTSAKKVEGGYLINGHKRWIGNASHAKYIVTWARETESGKV